MNSAFDHIAETTSMTSVGTAENSCTIVQRLDGSISSVDVFRALSHLPGCIFLDSALRSVAGLRHPCGRYSFVAADPYAWFRVGPWDGAAHQADPLQALQDHLSTFATPTISGLPPFQGGAAGLLSYELGHAWERIPYAKHNEFQIPVMLCGMYDTVVSFDHWQNEAWIVSQGTPETVPDRRRERARQRVGDFLRWIQAKSVTERSLPEVRTRVEITANMRSVAEYPGLFSNFAPEEYRAAVRAAIEYVHAGDLFQVNLTQRLLTAARDAPIATYLRLRSRTPAPFAAYFDPGEFQVISASPERFVQVRDRLVEARPIKGTRRRTRQPEADLFAGDELLCSDKDRAENVMIVDLLRNDLSRVCHSDSVFVPQLCGLENYGYVQHLVSVIRGRLADQATALDLVRCAFPGGSITGAPKVRAMEVISELEQVVRGPYCGSLGYVGYNGAMDLSILIRTLTAAGGWWQFPVGGGIVADSTPDGEYQETWHKAAGLLAALPS